jgi:hypothetical protein
VVAPPRPSVQERIEAQAELVRQRNLVFEARWNALERTAHAAVAVRQVLASRDWWADTTWDERYVIDELGRALEELVATREAFDAVKGAGP